MTSVYKRTNVVMTHEWIVPTNAPWGACWNEVELALKQAREKWLERNETTARIAAQDDRCVSVPDSAVRVKVGDDEIVVFFDEQLDPGVHNVLVEKEPVKRRA